MRSRHVYASVSLFKDYLAGDGISGSWTEDVNILRRLLESASLTIEQHVGDRCFGPFTATREYDLGRGAVRRRADQPGALSLIDGIQQASSKGEIGLGDWLTAVPETVTAYDGSARGSNTVLTEGLANDYLLEPDHQAPYDTFKLSENTANGLSAGQKTLAIIGEWGWQAVTEDTGETTDESTESSDTNDHINIASLDIISPGEIILLESEQIYVTSVASHGNHEGAYGIRGVNGTTAAAHTTSLPIYRYQYPSDVAEACMAISRDRYRSREAGTTALLGITGAPFPRPGAESRAILKSLNYYLQRRESSGVFF